MAQNKISLSIKIGSNSMINEVGTLMILISDDSTLPLTDWGWIIENYRFFECIVDKYNKKSIKVPYQIKSPADILTQK